jgi:hypothetical protein
MPRGIFKSPLYPVGEVKLKDEGGRNQVVGMGRIINNACLDKLKSIYIDELP